MCGPAILLKVAVHCRCFLSFSKLFRIAILQKTRHLLLQDVPEIHRAAVFCKNTQLLVVASRMISIELSLASSKLALKTQQYVKFCFTVKLVGKKLCSMYFQSVLAKHCFTEFVLDFCLICTMFYSLSLLLHISLFLVFISLSNSIERCNFKIPR